MKKAKEAVISQAPLIHCITNPISINDCANVVLALGAKPITATYLSVTDPLTACLLSAGTLGICGELADKSRGMGTYHIELINQLSTLSDAQLEQYLQIQRAL